MIDKGVNPTAWVLLAHDLSDAQEHLAQLIQEMQKQPDFSEEDYRISLAHTYAHLNRAWNRRNRTDAEDAIDQRAADWDGWTNFPVDIEPL